MGRVGGIVTGRRLQKWGTNRTWRLDIGHCLYMSSGDGAQTGHRQSG